MKIDFFDKFSLFTFLQQLGLFRTNTTLSSTPAELFFGGPSVWDDDTNSLYFVDLFTSQFCRYSVDDDTVYKAIVPGRTADYSGFIAPIKGRRNRFLVALNENMVVLKWNGVSSTATIDRTIFTVTPKLILNALLVGPNNNWFFGGFANTFCQNPANLSLYEYNQNKELSVAASGFSTTIGLVLYEKKNIVYQLDACAQIIYAYNYNPFTGHLCECHTQFFFQSAFKEL